MTFYESMMSTTPDGAFLFREPAGKPGEDGGTITVEKEAEERSPEEEEYILCRQCHQAITKPADRIVMQGSHRHTFANPHGIVFEIGFDYRWVRWCVRPGDDVAGDVVRDDVAA